MTRYFMRDTPLCQMEQQMMTPPYFKPRGHGRYYPGFQYSRDDMECPYCMNFRRNHPCPLEQCVCLDERIVAGAIDLNEFVRDCFFPEAGVQLQARLERSFNGCSIGFFLRDSHRERWQHWRARCYRMSGRNLAALFLLTAYEDIWRRMIWKFDARGFDFQSVQLSGIQPELYSVYQAAKAISTGSRNITLADLASPELVTDEAFHLIVCALLLAKYGDAILNFEGKYNFSQSRAIEIHTEAQDLIAMLPKDALTKMMVRQAADALNAVSKSLEQLKAEMRTLAAQLPEYPVVMAMRGVGDSLGPQLMAEIGDVTRFTHRGAITAFAGVDPGADQSGTHEAKSNRTSKSGPPELRRALFLVMDCLLKTQPQDDPVYRFMDKKRSEGKPYLVYMTAGVNKFLRIYYGRVKEYLATLEEN